MQFLTQMSPAVRGLSGPTRAVFQRGDPAPEPEPEPEAEPSAPSGVPNLAAFEVPKAVAGEVETMSAEAVAEAFVNGIAWNVVNLAIVTALLGGPFFVWTTPGA